MNEPYTPHTSTIRNAYVAPDLYPGAGQERREQFGRWLNRIRAGVWDECLNDIDEHELNTDQARAGNPYREGL